LLGSARTCSSMRRAVRSVSEQSYLACVARRRLASLLRDVPPWARRARRCRSTGRSANRMPVVPRHHGVRYVVCSDVDKRGFASACPLGMLRCHLRRQCRARHRLALKGAICLRRRLTARGPGLDRSSRAIFCSDGDSARLRICTSRSTGLVSRIIACAKRRTPCALTMPSLSPSRVRRL